MHWRSIMLLFAHRKWSQHSIVSPLSPGGIKRETAYASTYGLSLLSTSEVAQAVLRHPLTGFRNRLRSLEALSHLLKRCGIDLAPRIALAQDF